MVPLFSIAMRLSFAIVFSTLFLLSNAELEITSPAQTVQSPGTISIKWDPSTIGSMTNYVINLCAGGNSAGSYDCSLATLVDGGTFGTGSSASASVKASAGANSKNGYFLQFVATSSKGAKSTVYGPRFGMSGMKGKFPAKIASAAESADGKKGPAAEKEAAPAAAGASGPYAMAYTLQTGLTRYAPMQPVPSKKITATNTKPLYPTSSAKLTAKNYMGKPQQKTTLTQTQTHSVKSTENKATPLPQPDDDMQKFLARWRD